MNHIIPKFILYRNLPDDGVLSGMNEIFRKAEEKNPDIIDIKYSISNSVYSEEQLYCFSALIMYKDSK